MEKKKSKPLTGRHNGPNFIIPAPFYPLNSATKKSDPTPQQPVQAQGASESGVAIGKVDLPTIDREQSHIPLDNKNNTVHNEESRISDPSKGKIDLRSGTKRISGLSLSSLKAKKEHQLNRKEEVIDENDLPKNAFTEADLQKHWADFVDILDKGGRKILASNLHADVPKLTENFTIRIELPNGTMKKEVEREKYDLMEYLKQKLQNHFITLKIKVNEATAKKFAFTPEEKYEKLREKNPAIDLLRKEFDLDI